MRHLLEIVMTGVGATAMMDLWGFAIRPRLGFPPPSYRLIGRWFGHMPRGRFRHDRIDRASPIRGEHPLGWSVHYLIGISFAGLLVGVAGPEWLARPRLLPALGVGLGTVLAPLLLMQPGMGAGIAASRTPNPASARLQSLLTHAIYGLGLYLAGWGLHLLGIH